MCHCLPQDHRVTIERFNQSGSLAHDLQYQLDILPTIDEKNGTILAIVIKSMQEDSQVLIVCDILEGVVDGDASKKFVQNLRSGMYCVICIVGMMRMGMVHKNNPSQQLGSVSQIYKSPNLCSEWLKECITKCYCNRIFKNFFLQPFTTLYVHSLTV